MRILLRAAALPVLASLAFTASASAGSSDSPLPAQGLAVSAPGTTSASCQKLAAAGTPGIWQTTYDARAEGFASFRLRGGERAGDWDLAIFDARTRRNVDSSLAFGADELTQAWMRLDGEIIVQACRRAGAAEAIKGAIDYDVAAWPAKPAPVKLVRIPLSDTRRQVPILSNLGIDVEENVYPDHAFATVSAAQIGLLDKAGFVPKIVNQDVLASDRRILAQDAAKALALKIAKRSDADLRADPVTTVPSGQTTYRHYPDIQAALKKIVTDSPGLARAFTMPLKSYQGRDQEGVEISAAVDATDDQKPVSIIMGAHHAREWPSAEMPLEFAFYLTQQYGKDPRVTKLLNTTRVFIVPVINPDGFINSREAVDPADLTGDPTDPVAGLSPSFVESVGAGGSLAYRRKNCQGSIPSPSAPCDLQLGTDPNRNYGFGWGGLGASSSPNSQSYRGTGQWSAPESQSVHRFAQVHDVTTLVTTHTFASLVLRPPGLSNNGLAPDEERLKLLGDAMAADTGYTSEYSYQLYDTSGTTEDWNYGAAGTYGYTIELGPPTEDGGNFHITYQRAVIDQWNGTGPRAGLGMRNAYLTAAEYATSTQDFADLEGKAPAGRILRLKKTFKTFSSKVCTIASPTDVDAAGIVTGLAGQPSPTDCINPTDPVSQDDKLEYTTKVNQTGTFDWLVTPSTQPFDYKKGMTQAWTLTCEDASGKVYDTRQITIWRNEKAHLVLPCGAPSALPVTVTPAGVKDTLTPVSRFVKAKLKATRTGILINGTSKDDAPKGLKPALKSISVSLGKIVSATKCRFATADGRFGPVVDCVRTTYLPAQGTTKWSFVFNHALAKGKYFAWVRGTDVAGNVERKSRTRNLIKFTVK